LSQKPETAPDPSRKRHLFSLRFKFILGLTFLICAAMGGVAWLVVGQMRQTLTQQIINRGQGQALGLAKNSEEVLRNLLTKPVGEQAADLTLMQFMKDAVKLESAQVGSIPLGLSPWQETILAFSNRVSDATLKVLWPESAAQRGDTEYAFIVDKNGVYAAYNDIDGSILKAMERSPYTPPSGVLPLGDHELLKVQSYQENKRTLYDIAAAINVEGEGRRLKIGEIHLGFNQNSIIRAGRTAAVSIGLTTVAIILAGIVGMAVFVTILIKPIRLLVKGVSAIGAGNFDQKINIKRQDELGDLTDAFNEMAHSLREKEVIKGAFSKYVTKSVVDRILQHQDGLKLGGEKKEVTIFFSDIRGFTPMSEVLTPEEVVHLLNEYFTAMTAIIFKYEGTLDKFMGDAIMAVYGAPIDMPDHAERAVFAAIEMSAKMKELQAKWKAEGKREVNIGIGINSGEVIVGNIGSMERMEYTAIGDNVNLSQRLESVAEKGQILISSATYEKVKDKVNATPLEPIKLKGKAEKVAAYSVEGLKN